MLAAVRRMTVMATVVAVPLSMLSAMLAFTSLSGSALAAGTVASLRFSASPVAADGSLAAGSTTTFTVTAKDGTGTRVPGATVYLTSSRTTGGGTATVDTTTLSTTPRAFTANATGVVTITYQLPSTLPRAGRDSFSAANAASSATVTAWTSYKLTTVDRYLWSPDPVAEAGSLAANSTVGVTVQAVDVSGRPVPGVQICLDLVRAAGGGSAAVGSTTLSSSWSCFTADSSGTVPLTYRTGTTPPDTGKDTLNAEDTTKNTSVHSLHVYYYGAVASYALAPTPVAATATLAPRTSVTINVSPKDRYGNTVGSSTVYLSLIAAPGGGSAVVQGTNLNGTALTSRPQPFLVHSQIQMQIVYTTPSTLPTSGTDTVEVDNTPTGPSVSTTDTYAFSTAPAPPAPPAAPTVSSLSPSSGPVGTSVAITGTGLTGATAVSFNGTSTTDYAVSSPTTITATVPAGADTGPVSVTTPGGTATSTADFTVTTTPPPTGTQRFEETDPAITYSAGWSHAANASASGGYQQQTISRGAKATIGFTGDTVRWVTQVGPKRGIATLTIDGVSYGTVDTYAPAWAGQRTVFQRTGLGAGHHTLVIVYTGANPAAQTTVYLVLDAIEADSLG